MLSGPEIVRSLTGAWRLFLNRVEGMSFLDVSVEGFWRSFAAIWLIIPLYVVVTLGDRLLPAEAGDTIPPTDAAFWSANALSLALDWVTFPAVLAATARFLGIGRTYVAFVVARNWASVLESIPRAVFSLLLAAGVLSGEAYQLVGLAMLFVVLRYHYVVGRIALGVPALLNLGLVVADLLLSLLVYRGADWLFGV